MEIEIDGTVFRYASGYDCYVSEDGMRIFSCRDLKSIEIRSISNYGYYFVSGGFVHIIVATAFHGPRPSKDHIVHHVDHNKLNNSASNLMWINRRRHMEYHRSGELRVKEGTGSRYNGIKINDFLRLKIISMYRTQKNFALNVGINNSTITKIIRNKRIPCARQMSLIAEKLGEDVDILFPVNEEIISCVNVIMNEKVNADEQDIET